MFKRNSFKRRQGLRGQHHSVYHCPTFRPPNGMAFGETLPKAHESRRRKLRGTHQPSLSLFSRYYLTFGARPKISPGEAVCKYNASYEPAPRTWTSSRQKVRNDYLAIKASLREQEWSGSREPIQPKGLEVSKNNPW